MSTDLLNAIAQIAPPGSKLTVNRNLQADAEVYQLVVYRNALDRVTIPANEGPDKNTFHIDPEVADDFTVHENTERTPDTVEDLALSLSLARTDILALTQFIQDEIIERLNTYAGDTEALNARITELFHACGERFLKIEDQLAAKYSGTEFNCGRETDLALEHEEFVPVTERLMTGINVDSAGRTSPGDEYKLVCGSDGWLWVKD